MPTTTSSDHIDDGIKWRGVTINLTVLDSYLMYDDAPSCIMMYLLICRDQGVVADGLDMADAVAQVRERFLCRR